MSRQYCYLGGNRALTQLSTGQPFFVNTDDRGISTWIMLGGIWETFVDDVLCRLARPGMNFLDVGANMGYYSVKIGGLIGPGGKIFSFEPNPELYPFLKDNMEVNGFGPRAHPFQLAMADGEGSQDLKFDFGNMGGGSLFAVAGGSRVATVRVSTLDRCIPAGTRIDLAKIDAEGWEPRIFAGAKRVLRENPGMMILLEATVAQWSTYTKPLEVLHSLVGSEKEIFRIDTDGVVTPMSGVAEFVEGVDDFAYCVISPRASHARQALAGLMRDAAGKNDRDQPAIAAPANATVRQRTRDLIVNYVPFGEDLLRLRRSLMRRGSARNAPAAKDAAAPR